MKKVGILTFHAALNYGSVLQAQATQAVISRLGYDAELIDYRLPVMDRYDSVYCARGHHGWKGRALRALYPLKKRERTERIRKFEAYEKEHLVMSDRRYSSPRELEEIREAYDVFVSGSDQIWSEGVPEIKLSEEGAIRGYFLAFTDRKKISYASCTAAMKEEALRAYQKELERYAFLSAREKKGADAIEKILGRKVELVLDPSLLLTKEDWAAFAGSERLVEEPYLLLYSLRCGRVQRSWMNAIKAFNKSRKLKVVVIAPYFELPMPGALNMLASGPEEFLNLFRYAEVVFTDTFHGTAFAVNFNRPVYSIGNKYWKEDVRKSFLLQSLGMEDRLIGDEADITAVEDYHYDYSRVNRVLEEKREASLAYLKAALE